MIVGQRIRRPDALDKVKGSALYVEDVAMGGALLAGVLRSPHAHARIARLDVFAARNLPGVHAVLTAADIPGQNLIPMIQNDWPVLAQGVVRHVGEAVALVAAEDREALAAALAAIVVEYEILPARLDMEEALAAGEILAQWKVRRGEVEVALGRSDVVVVEGTYHTPYQEHAYIEPNGMVAWPEGPGVVVHGSMQCPFYVQKAVASALGCELSRARGAHEHRSLRRLPRIRRATGRLRLREPDGPAGGAPGDGPPGPAPDQRPACGRRDDHRAQAHDQRRLRGGARQGGRGLGLGEEARVLP